MSDTTTELILVRHGETDWNLRKCFQGQIDVPLNERGLAQAGRLARQLHSEGLRFDAAVSSDLRRARQTAEPACQLLGLPLRHDAAWREQAFGVLEGQSVDALRSEHPELHAQWQRHDPDYALPGGAESRRQFSARILAAAAAVAQRHRGGRVLVLTHGGALDMLWRAAQDQPLHGPRACAIPNAGINRLRWSPDGLRLLSWAEDQHLQALG